METGVGIDALNTSKRVERSSTDKDSVDSWAREDDLVKEIDLFAPDFGMLPWQPMNGRKLKFAPSVKGRRTKPIRQSESSSRASCSLEKEDSIVAQKRVGNESGNKEVITSPDVENSIPFQRSSKRIKGKEVESKGNYRQNFPVMGPYMFTRSMKRKADEIASSSKKEKDMSHENGCHGAALTEIDKLYSKARCCNSRGQQSGVSDNSNARASQIESDAIFARQLQEQFCHENTRFIYMEKVDDTMSWTLQRDGDEDEDEDGDTLYWNDHSRSALVDEYKRRIEREMDPFKREDIYNALEDLLETRLDIYEALEDLLDSMDMFECDNLESSHSSNNTAYAMQADIDESNHQHVGSSMDNLPLTSIQNANDKDSCAVCLEIPSVGETMRFLPCLHRFHKMCIDAWLKIKPSCPVCKFNII